MREPEEFAASYRALKAAYEKQPSELDSHFDSHSYSGYFIDILIFSVDEEDLGFFSSLLEFAEDREINAVLMEIIRNKKVEAIKVLINKGALPPSWDWMHCFSVFLEECRADILKMLMPILKEEQRSNLINLLKTDKSAKLTVCVKEDNFQMLCLLLESGATPMDILGALKSGKLKAAAWLLLYDAKIEQAEAELIYQHKPALTAEIVAIVKEVAKSNDEVLKGYCRDFFARVGLKSRVKDSLLSGAFHTHRSSLGRLFRSPLTCLLELEEASRLLCADGAELSRASTLSFIDSVLSA